MDARMADRYTCGTTGGRGRECRMKAQDEQTQVTNTTDGRTFTSRRTGKRVHSGEVRGGTDQRDQRSEVGRQADELSGGLGRPLTAFHAQVWLFPRRQQRWSSPSSRARACSCLWRRSVGGRLRGTERKRLAWQMFLILSSVGTPGGKGSSRPMDITGWGLGQAWSW